MAGTETVVVIRPPGKDTFGDPLPGTGQQYQMPGCRFAPGPSLEFGGLANAVQTDGTVYATKGTTEVPGGVLSTDLVEVRGIEYTVAGEPQDWGKVGVVIAVRRYTG